MIHAELQDRYALEGELGRGGMATVFLVRDRKHDRQVALKVLDPELTSTVGPRRFKREIRFTARLQHAHILPLLDSGVAGHLLYYVTPYVKGETLRERIARGGPLPLEEAIRIAMDVAAALDYAHRQGIVHRDIKPENILLSDQQAMVTDFGIARAMSPEGDPGITATGGVVGTLAYMSPEQAVGSRKVDGRADVYSLACVLYEMLVGRPPFVDATTEGVLRKHLYETPPPIEGARPDVPAPIRRALAAALAKAPASRTRTAAEFARALGATDAPAGRLRASLSGGGVWRLAPVAALLLALAALAAWRACAA
ncbi:MAG: serine/threonine-protein kinase [Gemmatimonadota bacterium]